MDGDSVNRRDKVVIDLGDPLIDDKKERGDHVSSIPTPQKLPSPPRDFCTLCDPICADDLKLAILSTFCCWLFLGVLPAGFGILGIYFAAKSKSSDDESKREYYSMMSRTISWLGMLLFCIASTIGIIILATCGVL